MTDEDTVIKIVIFILLIAVQIMLYGFSSALQAINEKELEGREGKSFKDGRKTGLLLNLKKKPIAFVNTLQLTVTVMHLLIGVYIAGFSEHRMVIVFVFLISAYIMVSLGIVLSKNIALKNPYKWAYGNITFVHLLIVLLRPFIFLITKTASVIMIMLHIDPNEFMEDVTEEEIISMVNEGHEQGIFNADEAEMIANVFEFADKQAKDIMTHRTGMIAIDGSNSLEEAMAFILSENYSRYPVYEDNLDNIIGIIHLKDAMKFYSESNYRNMPLSAIKDLIMEAVFIPETRNIDVLLKNMQKSKIHMVIVVDEYGQTSGLIAMEDIVEEIVGNIFDEHDDVEEYMKQVEDNAFICEGRTPLEEVKELLSIPFEEDEFDTLNGFIIAKLDHIPSDDEEFSFIYEGCLFKILKIENKMIESVLIRRLEERQEDEEQNS